MDHQPPLGDQLETFIAHLEGAGFSLGAREQSNMLAVAAAAMVGGSVRTIDDLAPYLAPIVAKSQEDRSKFQDVLGLFAPHAEVLAPKPAEPVSESLKLVVAFLALLCVIGLAIYLMPQRAAKPPAPPKASPTVEASYVVAKPSPVIVAETNADALNRIEFAARRFGGAATLTELSESLAAQSPINWTARSYAARLRELTELPDATPLAMYGKDGLDGHVWAVLALALHRIETPGLEPSFASLVQAANSALAKARAAGGRPLVYEIAALYQARFAEWSREDPGRLIDGVQVAYHREVMKREGEPEPHERIDPQTVMRGVVIADPGLHAIFANPPWLPALPERGLGWLPWFCGLVPIVLACAWFSRTLALRKAYLRRRPPMVSPLHVDLVSKLGSGLALASAPLQAIQRQLRTRSRRKLEALDPEASIAATIASGGEIVVPVLAEVSQTPEYLVLCEQESALDQNASRLRDIAMRLGEAVPTVIYFYRDEPSLLEGASGQGFASIRELQARYPDHRLVVLGTGTGFLEPGSLRLRRAASSLMHWEHRALLTPLPVGEWGHEEFALADHLQIPIGRATTQGLRSLAQMLGLTGAASRSLLYPEGDGLARALPAELRLFSHRYLYNRAPPERDVETLVTHLRNYLDDAGFEWLCALAVYPAVQWDLTLFLGTSLAEVPGEALEQGTLYREDRIAALTQLPWLRRGAMPNWLRALLIKELSPTRASEVRNRLLQLIAETRLDDDAPRTKAIKLRIAREDAWEAAAAENPMQDEVLVDFLARGRLEDFALPASSWLERFLPHALLQRLGVPELLYAIAAVGYAGAAFALAPAAGTAATIAAWLPIALLLVGATGVVVAIDPAGVLKVLRAALLSTATLWLALPVLAIVVAVVFLTEHVWSGDPSSIQAAIAQGAPRPSLLLPSAAVALFISAGWIRRQRNELARHLPAYAKSLGTVSLGLLLLVLPLDLFSGTFFAEVGYSILLLAALLSFEIGAATRRRWGWKRSLGSIAGVVVVVGLSAFASSLLEHDMADEALLAAGLVFMLAIPAALGAARQKRLLQFDLSRFWSACVAIFWAFILGVLFFLVFRPGQFEPATLTDAIRHLAFILPLLLGPALLVVLLVGRAPKVAPTTPAAPRHRFAGAQPAAWVLAALLPIVSALGLSVYVRGSSTELARVAGGATALAGLAKADLLAVGDKTGKIHLYEATGARRHLATLPTGNSAVSAIVLARQSSAAGGAVLCLAATEDGRAHFFDVQTGARLPLEVPAAAADGKPVSALRISLLGPAAAPVIAAESQDAEVEIAAPGGRARMSGRGPITAWTPIADDRLAVSTLDGEISIVRVPTAGPPQVISTQVRAAVGFRQLQSESAGTVVLALDVEGRLSKYAVDDTRLSAVTPGTVHAQLALGPAVGWRSPAPPAQARPDPASPPANSRDAVEVSVLFATNRKPGSTEKSTETYGIGWGELAFGETTVTIPKTHVAGTIDLPSLWKLEREADPERHFILSRVAPARGGLQATGVEDKLRATQSRQLLLFVHGYNNGFEEAALRTAQLAYDMQFPGVPFFYTWPSANKVRAYLQDEEAARLSESVFATLLDQLTKLPLDKIYIISHGMGARIVGHGTQQFIERGNQTGKIKEIIFIAPDINAELFKDVVAPKLMLMQGTRTTIYADSSDISLMASKVVHGFRRVGESNGGVLVYRGIDTIDASRLATGVRKPGSSVLENSQVRADIGEIISGKPRILRAIEVP